MISPSVPKFETKRLILREITLEDAPSYQKNFNDHAVISQLAAKVPWPYPENGAEEFIRTFILPQQGKGRWFWGIFLSENPKEIIGGIDLWRAGTPENRGFWLGKNFWGRGLMTEAVEPILDYAFDHLGFETLVFSNALGNTKSRRVKEKTGARLIGTRPEKFVNPEYSEAETWELTKKEWRQFRLNFGLPFEGQQSVSVIPATDFSEISNSEATLAKEFRRLIEENQTVIERELGCAFEFAEDRAEVLGARWLIGPSAANPEIRKLNLPAPCGPEIYIDRKSQTLVSDGTTADEVMETFSWLRSLGKREDGLWKIRNCKTLDEAIERIQNEVKMSFPAFELHHSNWAQICERHIPLVKSAADPIPAMQRWMAELGDAHTWIRPIPAFGQFPYDLFTEGKRAYFYRVSEDSVASKKGVRPGFELMDENIEDWWARTSASPHGKPFVVGARLLASPVGTLRKFKAKSPTGLVIEWQEAPVANRWTPLAKWRLLSSGTAYLRIEAWMVGHGLEEDIERAFEKFKAAPKLVVDLRANPGGNLLMAHRFRNRFLQKSGPVGWIRTTLPNGQLGEREPILGELVPEEKRWLKPVIFLTDALTYSASEDALLGLQGQPQVKVIGQRSGGGSGRVRILKLLEGWRLTISTALTYDHSDNCIEGSGIPLDHEYPISFNSEDLINEAEAL